MLLALSPGIVSGIEGSGRLRLERRLGDGARWRRANGLFGATAAVLMDLGWDPIMPDVWKNSEGDVVLLDFFVRWPVKHKADYRPSTFFSDQLVFEFSDPP